MTSDEVSMALARSKTLGEWGKEEGEGWGRGVWRVK